MVQLFVQNGGEVRIGDLWIGYSVLLDVWGQEIGFIDWQMKVFGGLDDGEIWLVFDVIMNLEIGNFYVWLGVYMVVDLVLDLNIRIVLGDQVCDIIGGLGVFEWVIGVIIFLMQENGDV